MKKKTRVRILEIAGRKAIQIATTASTNRYEKKYKHYMVYVLFDDGSVRLLLDDALFRSSARRSEIGFKEKQLPNIPLGRKIVKISATTEATRDTELDEPLLFALCADGSLWCLKGYDGIEWEWFPLLGVPRQVCPI